MWEFPTWHVWTSWHDQSWLFTWNLLRSTFIHCTGETICPPQGGSFSRDPKRLRCIVVPWVGTFIRSELAIHIERHQNPSYQCYLHGSGALPWGLPPWRLQHQLAVRFLHGLEILQNLKHSQWHVAGMWSLWKTPSASRRHLEFGQNCRVQPKQLFVTLIQMTMNLKKGCQSCWKCWELPPLQQLPVPDSFKRLDVWHHLRRNNGETIPQLLVREEDLFVQLQSALTRARQDRDFQQHWQHDTFQVFLAPEMFRELIRHRHLQGASWSPSESCCSRSIISFGWSSADVATGGTSCSFWLFWGRIERISSSQSCSFNCSGTSEHSDAEWKQHQFLGSASSFAHFVLWRGWWWPFKLEEVTDLVERWGWTLARWWRCMGTLGVLRSRSTRLARGLLARLVSMDIWWLGRQSVWWELARCVSQRWTSSWWPGRRSGRDPVQRGLRLSQWGEQDACRGERCSSPCPSSQRVFRTRIYDWEGHSNV